MPSDNKPLSESARGKHTQGIMRVADYPNDAQALWHTKLL